VGDAAAPTLERIPYVVGREAERARVDAFAGALPTGPRALVIAGEPGIGKTTLWRYGVEHLRQAGAHVLVARPSEEEMPLSLVGLSDLFERAGLDEVALGADDDPIVRGRGVLAGLRRLAGSSPTVVAIDDVQWLDSVSAHALRYALRRLDTEPVGILATTRSGPEAGDPLEAATALMPGRAEAVELGPLGLGALRRVLSGTVAAISRPALRRIHEVSGGNPLYAIELARGLAADERAHRTVGGLPLPDSLQAAIARRLETVPAELAPLLEVASALGRTSTRELRAALPDADVDGLLGVAQKAGLLVVEQDSVVRYAHPLVGSAVYRRMTPLARRSLHGRLAGLAADPDVRARHLALSTDDPDPAVSALLEEAMQRASGRGAPDLAAEFAGHSLRLTPEGDEEAEHRRALAQIEHLAAAGEMSRALALADRLVGMRSPGPRRAEALVQRADLEDDDRATAEALLLGALEDAGDDSRLRGLVLTKLAHLRRWRFGDVRGALQFAREALALAESAGDARLEAQTAAYLAHMEALAGSPRPELMERAVRLEEEIGTSHLSIGPRSLLAKQRLWDGDLPGARAVLEAVRAAAARAGDEIQRPQHFYDLSLVECAAGNLVAAGDLVREGIEAARDAENTNLERELLYPLALVEAWLGRADAARSAAARLHEDAARRGVQPLLVRARSVLGVLALAEGDAESAARELTAAAASLDEMGFAHPGAFPVLGDAVEALARSGDTDSAEQLLARLEQQAEAVDSASVRAAGLRARGAVLLAAGRPQEATPVLERALESFDRLGFRPDAARSLLTLGRAWLRAGVRTQAARALADARERFAGLGAPLWEVRAAEDLDRASPRREKGELTAAERRVAALVAEGLRNQEIAQSLSMSVATVEAHLTRVYRKLAIRSRSELTRLVAEGGAPVSD
jgi:DNA-binding CsgD family transcriptional regulator